MITIGMNYEILEGKESAFEKKFALVIELMSGMDGHVTTRLYRDAHAPQSYLVVSEWASSDAYQAFIRSEAFAKTTRWGRENILATRPSHRVYESGPADMAQSA